MLCYDYTDTLLGMTLIAPSKMKRKIEWDYDRELCRLGNENKRRFHILLGYRNISAGFDKLDSLSSLKRLMT